MQKYIERLQFITHDIVGLPHVEQVQKACNAGAKWIQYRCLSKGDDDLLVEINQIAEICDDWGSTLIVTNHCHLAGKADIQGFHIEDFDADFITMRRQLGDAYTLGGSATNIPELIRLAKEEVDYAGFGPYAVSETKPNNFTLVSPKDYALGVNTIENLGLHLPVIAVGGVSEKDITNLMATGIYGIAVSIAITSAPDFETAYKEFNNLVAPRL